MRRQDRGQRSLPMKTYCVKCNTTHDDSVPCFDGTAQAASDMGMKEAARPPSPEQARRDKAALSRAVALIIAAALLLLVGGAFLFSK